MAYIAKHHVTLAGCRYTPGELITEPIPAKTLERFLRLGAVVREPIMYASKMPEDDFSDCNATDDNSDGVQENAPADSEDEVPEEAEMPEEAAPEIDVADGIVAVDDETAPKRAKGRKKA